MIPTYCPTYCPVPVAPEASARRDRCLPCLQVCVAHEPHRTNAWEHAQKRDPKWHMPALHIAVHENPATTKAPEASRWDSQLNPPQFYLYRFRPSGQPNFVDSFGATNGPPPRTLH